MEPMTYNRSGMNTQHPDEGLVNFLSEKGQ